MPVLHLTEDEVRGLLTMETAIEAVESGLRKMALEEAFNVPRSRCQTDHVMLHVLPAAAKTLGVIGYKAYVTTRSRHAISRHDLRRQDRRDARGHAGGLPRPDAHRGGVRGGDEIPVPKGQHDRRHLRFRQAGPHAAPRRVEGAQADAGRSSGAHRRNGGRRSPARCRPPAASRSSPAARPEEAARGLDIICTATSAREPVLFGEWALAGPAPERRRVELPGQVGDRRRSGQAGERGRHRQQGPGPARGRRPGRGARPGGDRVDRRGRAGPRRRHARRRAGSRPEDITLFKSLGIGLEDIAVAIEGVSESEGGRRRPVARACRLSILPPCR